MGSGVGKRIGRWFAAVLTMALLAGIVVAYLHRGEIRDYFAAAGFTPSKRIVEVQQEIDLTPAGERIFLASRPTIGGREEFSEWCAKVDHSEQGHVLGCYTDSRIRLFEVTDERLAGIVEVTAAHELLHAVFGRMTAGERERVSKELRSEYARLAEKNPELEERMGVYSKLSAASFANELHSVLGTEIADLSPELEEHYARWLGDRAGIVQLYESYRSVFEDLTAQVKSLSAELEALRADIEKRNAAYDEDVRRFNADANDFKARNERYEFSGNEALFDEIRSDLLRRQAELGERLAALQADTKRFNEMREELIALNSVSVELNSALDSSLPTPTERPAPDD